MFNKKHNKIIDLRNRITEMETKSPGPKASDRRIAMNEWADGTWTATIQVYWGGDGFFCFWKDTAISFTHAKEERALAKAIGYERSGKAVEPGAYQVKL